MRPAHRSRKRRQLLENLKAGKGTAGKVLNDDEIANQLTLISQKVNTAIDKINSGQGTIGQLHGKPATLRLPERNDARSEFAGQGYARESEEVPANQAGDFLTGTRGFEAWQAAERLQFWKNAGETACATPINQ